MSPVAAPRLSDASPLARQPLESSRTRADKPLAYARAAQGQYASLYPAPRPRKDVTSRAIMHRALEGRRLRARFVPRRRPWIRRIGFAPYIVLAAITAACGGGLRHPVTRLVQSSCQRLPLACPRDAARDASDRCACIREPGSLVLGACVPVAVADVYCGRGAHMGLDGCVFRACDEGQSVDLASGQCVDRAGISSVASAEGACPEKTAAAVIGGEAQCIAADATCPRGSRRVGSACLRPPSCPPGTLAVPTGGRANGGRAGAVCQSVVSMTGRGTLSVDVGLWKALLGSRRRRGPRGSDALCSSAHAEAGRVRRADGSEHRRR